MCAMIGSLMSAIDLKGAWVRAEETTEAVFGGRLSKGGRGSQIV